MVPTILLFIVLECIAICIDIWYYSPRLIVTSWSQASRLNLRTF
jgi:hypothetical protein